LCGNILRARKEANPRKTEIPNKSATPPHEGSSHPTPAILGEDVQFIEIEKADTSVELGNANEHSRTPASGALSCFRPPSRASSAWIARRSAANTGRSPSCAMMTSIVAGGSEDISLRYVKLAEPSTLRLIPYTQIGILASGGGTMPDFPRFLFRVKDRQIEEEAKKMVASIGLTDIEIRRDDTIKDAWLEDNKILKTTYGLEDIQAYLENLTS
jgi:hypothetical protein